MNRVDVLVVGAGHAGLAVSRLLTDAGRDHVVVDRGRVAESWRTRRWESLRLLTPSWMTRLPGWTYQGADPDGFMRSMELVNHLEAYAESFGAPVLHSTTVLDVRRHDDGPGRGHDGYRVVTDQGTWLAGSVVVATGHCDRPAMPDFAADLPVGIQQLSPLSYRNPDEVASGAVLVVGASASGVQIADELAAAGRDVVLSAGRHTRAPRRYRERDIMWWLSTTGQLDRTVDDVADQAAARSEPSMQIVGRDDGRDVGLAELHSRGVRVVGRTLGWVGSSEGLDRGGFLRLGEDLPGTTAAADDGLRRLLDRFDRCAPSLGLTGHGHDSDRPAAVALPPAPDRLDLAAEKVGAVVWATGLRSSYPWLRLPVLDRHGRIRQRLGATPSPGLFVIGQRFQQRRDSSFIDGARHDARHIVDAIVAGLPAPLAAAS
jgi:putative flavoprotein involved in K+ transport